MTGGNIVLAVLGVLVFLIVLVRFVKRFYHRPAPPIVHLFLDSPMRRWGQQASKVIERSGIRPGMTVLDLGCGSGALTIPLARAVGKEGKVYALDIQPAMLKLLEGKLARPENRNIKNVEIKLGNAYELPFPDSYLDAVVMVTVLPEIPDRSRALREIKRVLKPGGILAVSELLPDPDYPRRSTTIKQCTGEGFVLNGSFGNLWSYTVRFRKPLN